MTPASDIGTEDTVWRHQKNLHVVPRDWLPRGTDASEASPERTITMTTAE